MTPPEDIYLSVVVTSRNDNHGGKIMARMRHCFASLAEQARHYRLPIQLLLVDWNPPSDRPPLAEVEGLAVSNEFFRFDVVTVPHEVHARLPLAADIPLFQYYGKNVGIRRARGRFILGTNVDVIFADALAAHLAEQPLKPGRIYRNDRVDTEINDRLDDLAPEIRQETCLRNVVQINTRYGTVPTAQFAERIAGLSTSALPGIFAEFLTGVLQKLDQAMPGMPPHLTACGDFQLLAREDWDRLRGYAELPIHSWHINSLFAFQCRAAGITEEMLPTDCPIFHVHHTPGWGYQGNMEGGLERQLLKVGDDYRLCLTSRDMPVLTSDEVDRFKEGIAFAPAATVNGRDWGYAGIDFPTVTRV